MASFKIKSVFCIQNRGQVVAGDIINGEVSSVDFVQIPCEGNMIGLEINSVEFLDHIGEKKI